VQRTGKGKDDGEMQMAKKRACRKKNEQKENMAEGQNKK